MAINDFNSISPVESLQNIVVAHEKKEKKKKEKGKTAKNNEPDQQTPEKGQQAGMANNEEHLLDFRA